MTKSELKQIIREVLHEELAKINLAEGGAMSGGYAQSGSIDRYARPGASIQPSKNGYLNRLKSKNPDLVEITTVKGKDVKPGMLTQAGQVKEAEVKKNNRGETKVYIMHTNKYDGFWDVDEDMEVLADPENRSKPFTGDYRSLLKMGLKESASSVHLKLHKDPSEKWWEYDQDCYLIGKNRKYKLRIVLYEAEPDYYNEYAKYKIDVEIEGVNFKINHRKLADVVGCSNFYLQHLEWDEAVRMCDKIYSYFINSKDDTYFLLVNDLGCPAAKVTEYFDANSELSVERFGDMYENLWNSNHRHPDWLKMEKLLDTADPKQEMSPEDAYEASSSEIRVAVSNLITSF